MVYSHDGIPFSNENEEAKPMQQHEGIPQTVLSKTDHTKEHTLYDFIYIKFKKDKLSYGVRNTDSGWLPCVGGL